MNSSPVRVALINDYELIVEGLAAMLAPFGERITVVDTDIEGTPDSAADIALFDTFAGRRRSLDRARAMVEDVSIDRVVIYTWDVPDDYLTEIDAVGVDAVILKSTSGADLVEAIEQIARGEIVDGAHRPVTAARSTLTDREQEVLVMLADGLSNREIAEQLYLSVDTIKTHVRKLFRKLDVSNRTQAARIAVENGFTRRRVGATSN